MIAREPTRQTAMGAWLSAGGLLIALAWIGSRLVFAQFQNYDDEGYLLITVKQFVQGLPLYDSIYTQYGPAYYLWQQLLHGVLGIPLTHDATRMVTVALWIVSSGIIGSIVWLLTKRMLLTTIGVGVAFLHLTQLTFEPGHPQELCLLAVLGALSIAMWRLARRGSLDMTAATTAGMLTAIAVLTKINVGAFLVGAVTLGLTTSLRDPRWRTWLSRAAVGAAFAAVPVLMHDHLRRIDIAAWIVAVWSGLLSVHVAGQEDGSEDGVVGAREVIGFALTFAVACAVVIAAIVATGTSMRALFDGLFVWPRRLPVVFWRPLPVPVAAAIAAPIWIIAAFYWRRHASALERWMPFIALASGLTIFMLSIAKAYGPLLAWSPPLAWLALADRSLDPANRAARRLLVYAAVIMALQAYPMPDGTQIGLGTVLFVPVALAAMAGAERSLRANAPSSIRPRPLGRRAILAVLVVAVVANIGVRAQRLYASGIPLAMPGAESVRTSERDVGTYWWLTENLRANCDGFITAPGLNSLHFWTGLAPVSALNTTLWPILFDDGQQQRVVAAAAQVERLCVVWSPERMDALMTTPQMARRPLVTWLRGEFEPKASFNGWEFRTRRGHDATVVYQGRWDDERIKIELPPLGRDVVAHLEVVDTDANRTLADSAHENELTTSDDTDMTLRADRGIDVSRARRLTLTPSGMKPSRASVVVRLSSRDGRAIAIVPVAQ
jgi:hypothetical protein